MEAKEQPLDQQPYTKTYSVPNIDCDSCISFTIPGILKSLCDSKQIVAISGSSEGTIKKLYVTYASQQVSNKIETEFFEKMNTAAYPASPFNYSAQSYQEAEAAQKNIIRTHWLNGILAGFSGFSLFAVEAIGIPLSMAVLYTIASLSFIVMCYTSRDMFRKAYNQLRSNTINNMDSLFTFSTLLSWTASFLSLFFPALHLHTLFSTPLLLLGFRNIGKAVEKTALGAISSPPDHRDLIPEQVSLFSTPSIPSEQKTLRTIPSILPALIPVAQLLPGDVIQLPPKTVLPTDGKPLNDTFIKQEILDGNEEEPTFVKAQTPLFAGMVTTAETLIKVTQPIENSHLAKRQQFLHQLKNKKTPPQTQTINYLKFFVPVIVCLALALGLLTTFMFDISTGINTFLAIAVAICPCAYSIVGPLNKKAAAAKARLYHIEIIDPDILSQLKTIDGVICDLNGTLLGKSTVSNITFLETVGDDKQRPHDHYLNCLDALEKDNSHGFATAIREHVRKQNIPLTSLQVTPDPSSATDLRGVRGTINNRMYTIGSREFVEEKCRITVNPAKLEEKKSHSIDPSPQQHVYMAVEGIVVADIHITTPIKPGAQNLLGMLREEKKEIMLCTGASEEVATLYATQLEIPLENIRFKCTGEAKQQDHTFPKMKEIMEWKRGFSVLFSDHWPLESPDLSPYGKSFICVSEKNTEAKTALSKLYYINDQQPPRALQLQFLTHESWNNFVHFSQQITPEPTLSDPPKLPVKMNLTTEQNKNFLDLLNHVSSTDPRHKFHKPQGRRFAFIGDGSNDDGALGVSDASIHLKNPWAPARLLPAGQATIHSGSLQPVTQLFELSSQTERNTALCLTVATIYNLAAIAAPTALLYAINYEIDPAWEVAFTSLEMLMILFLIYALQKQALTVEQGSDHSMESGCDEDCDEDQSLFHSHYGHKHDHGHKHTHDDERNHHHHRSWWSICGSH